VKIVPQVKRGLVIVGLDLDHTNAEITDVIGFMKAVRESGEFSNIVCCVNGFDDDPRELWDIPEVRAFAARLITLGFPAFLDVCPSADPKLNGGLGAAELVWVAAGWPVGRPVARPDGEPRGGAEGV